MLACVAASAPPRERAQRSAARTVASPDRQKLRKVSIRAPAAGFRAAGVVALPNASPRSRRGRAGTHSARAPPPAPAALMLVSRKSRVGPAPLDTRQRNVAGFATFAVAPRYAAAAANRREKNLIRETSSSRHAATRARRNPPFPDSLVTARKWRRSGLDFITTLRVTADFPAQRTLRLPERKFLRVQSRGQ